MRKPAARCRVPLFGHESAASKISIPGQPAENASPHRLCREPRRRPDRCLFLTRLRHPAMSAIRSLSTNAVWKGYELAEVAAAIDTGLKLLLSSRPGMDVVLMDLQYAPAILSDNMISVAERMAKKNSVPGGWALSARIRGFALPQFRNL